MTDISSQTLHFVAKELAVTLNDARAALEAYAERPDQRDMLEKCADHLHLAHGVLRLVEVYGAALLAEEMEHVTRYLLESAEDEKRQTDGLDALMRAMVQLPTYLERVLSGGRDLALVLLPLLNDLRSVRGSPLLSEGTLLLLNLKSDQPAQPREAGEERISVALWARRLRPRFQVGLLGLIRGERTDQNLEIMAKVAEKLEQVATTQPVFQFWWVTGAILEALRENGLEASATLKRLLGQADRQIKALYEAGEARYGENPPIDLLNNLLYYVARSSVGGGRIGAVRASFKLAELLPVDDSIEQERESLSAPSVKLMRTVAAAIKEDLAKVKDVLDIFVRRGGGRSEELAPQLELLKKISDTLGVLGLGELRQRVQAEVADLNALLAAGEAPAEDALIKIAGVLLSVEDSLDDQLVRLILPTAAAATGSHDAADLDFRLVSEAVLRECIVNLARIKEAISVAVQKPGDSSPQGLDNVPQLLRGITAGLLMLGKGRAAELMDAIGVHVRKLVEPGAPAADPLRLERVADAIVSIEYYMETIQSGRNDPWYMLDNAAICVKALTEDTLEPVPALGLDAAAQAAADAAATVQMDAPATVAIDRTAHPPTATLPHVGTIAAAPLDPQLVELFIEEAKEEMASIGTSFPLWEQNPMDTDALATMRRSFHTLKGSGRMVGARQIGDLAWSIENLLNRVIDKTATRTPAMVAVIRAAVAALPQAIEQLETGRPCVAPVDEIIARAHACAGGREDEETAANAAPEERGAAVPLPPEAVVAQPAAADARAPEPIRQPESHLPPAAQVQAPPVTAMDPVLHDIYSKEAAHHLAAISEYLQKRRGQLAPHDLPENIYRAVHTLCGSSKMAEARHGIRVTEPLNNYLRKVYESGRGLSDAGLALLADAVAAIENVVAHINESTVFFAEQPVLLDRIRAQEAELDAEVAQAGEDAAASTIVPALGVPAEPEGFDHEIANIYSEEATELLESAQVSLGAWNDDRANKTPVAELQRQLHTLKGGARMAGISAMGDLSHELESLVIQIDGGLVSGDERAHAVLQASLDELARMRDTVGTGSLPQPAAVLIARIRALVSGPAAEAPESVPAAPKRPP